MSIETIASVVRNTEEKDPADEEGNGVLGPVSQSQKTENQTVFSFSKKELGPHSQNLSNLGVQIPKSRQFSFLCGLH